jgi:methyl halide transferase
MTEKEYSREDWQGHYESNDLGWDLGHVAPPFAKLWEEEKLPVGKALVPGCGRGHEVIFLAENGFEVTAIDFSKGAVTYLESALDERSLSGRVLHQDFFCLDNSHDGIYDLVLEQTFFCAIAPRQRKDYVLNVMRILKPGGILVGLFYQTDKEGGPPYNTTREDIEVNFAKNFKIQELNKTSLSAEQRKDKEWLGILKKKD